MERVVFKDTSEVGTVRHYTKTSFKQTFGKEPEEVGIVPNEEPLILKGVQLTMLPHTDMGHVAVKSPTK